MKRSPLKRKTPLKRVPFKRKIKTPSRNPNSVSRTAIKKTVRKHPPRRRLAIKIDPLDVLVSEYVRKRAVQRVGGCEHCLKPYRWQDLECSHFFGRKDKSTRYDTENLAALCYYCHEVYFHAHPLEHVRWFKEHLGEEAFALLEGRNRVLGKPDKKAIELYLRQQIKLLEDNNV